MVHDKFLSTVKVSIVMWWSIFELTKSNCFVEFIETILNTTLAGNITWTFNSK